MAGAVQKKSNINHLFFFLCTAFCARLQLPGKGVMCMKGEVVHKVKKAFQCELQSGFEPFSPGKLACSRVQPSPGSGSVSLGRLFCVHTHLLCTSQQEQLLFWRWDVMFLGLLHVLVETLQQLLIRCSFKVKQIVIMGFRETYCLRKTDAEGFLIVFSKQYIEFESQISSKSRICCTGSLSVRISHLNSFKKIPSC